MDSSDALTVIAEVGIALAGFTGVVVVMGRRAHGDWTPAENVQLALLLRTSLLAVLFALLPIVLLQSSISETTAWRVLVGALGAGHLAVSAASWRGLIANFGDFPTSWRRLGYLGTTGGAVLIVAALVTAAGFLAPHLVLVYLLNLLWMLVLAAVNFAYLLSPKTA